jgi:hypothetical protein
MFKKVLIIAALLSLVGAFGCSISSKTGTESSTASVKPIREAEIASQWAMKQIEINLEAETSIMFKLAAGDKVDGYFYLIKGDGISFSILGNSLIYESKAADAKAPGVASDRFSFTASQAQGIAYTLKLDFVNGDSKEKTGVTVFLEFIYPASGEVFVPMGTN